MTVGMLLTIAICITIIGAIIASTLSFIRSLFGGNQASGGLGSKAPATNTILDTATKILAFKEAMDVITGGNKR